MTGRQFTETGLHKLSPEELAALNQWIRERSLAEYEGPPEDDRNAAAAAPPGRPGEAPEIEDMAREKFQSRIVGEFSGWSGNTRFELENGTVWKQDERDRLRIQPIESPMATLTPGAFGAWRLSIEGQNRAVRVERIE
ncbi:MAG: hypothetical protein KGY53_08215 [Wenzhouxiangellaceae bacterium]|nr:hypothetical protein [Wenzhouxiangellaceae bacterium]MBS3823872.1 hypothetical protein [Wenzhouxiangellaceae bacterium]